MELCCVNCTTLNDFKTRITIIYVVNVYNKMFKMIVNPLFMFTFDIVFKCVSAGNFFF